MAGRRAAAGTAALGAGLLVAAVLFGAKALYVPGLALPALVALAAAWVGLGLRGGSVKRCVGARRVVEGDRVESWVEARLVLPALPGTSIADPLLPMPIAVPVGTRSVRVRVFTSCPRRGRHGLVVPTLELRDPLGLLVRRLEAEPDEEGVLVLPRVEPVAAGAGSGAGVAAGSRRATAGAAEVELDGVRPYRQGTPASRIHWPAVARGGELVERRLLPEADTRPLVVLDTRQALSEDDLDAAVRAVASLAAHLARDGGCAVLLPGDRRATTLDAPLRRWAPLHARLALVEAVGAPSGAVVAARRGPLLWVRARRGSAVPRALAHAPAVTRTLVVPGALAGRRPAFAVGGCAGYLLAARGLGAVA